MRSRHGDRLGIAEYLEALAVTAAARGGAEEAARLFGAVDTVREALGTPLRPPDQADHASTPGPAIPASPAGAAHVPAVAPRAAGPLSPRETEVARLVARGMTNREIAAALYITEGTAATHAQHILTKLGFRYLEETIACARSGTWTVRRTMLRPGSRVRFEQGRWAEAGDLAAQVASKQGVSPITRIVAFTVLGRIRARRGDPQAADALDEAWRLAEVTGDLQRLWPAAAGRAELAWLSGESDRIPALVEPSLALAQRLRSRWAIGELAYWLWKAGALPAPPGPSAEPFAMQMRGD